MWRRQFLGRLTGIVLMGRQVMSARPLIAAPARDGATIEETPREKRTEVVDIGARRQLFIDDYLVEKMEYAARLLHPPTKHPEPVIEAEKPWEKGRPLSLMGNTVFYDEEEKLYKMYYSIYEIHPDLSEDMHLAYAFSRDGLHWEKPNLGIADYKGSKANNLLDDFESPRYAKDWWIFNNVIKDTHDPNPARRYKALGHGILNRRARDSNRRIGVIVAFSPDGLHWTEPADNPVLPNADTHTLLGWDDRINKYVAYPRTVHVDDYVNTFKYLGPNKYLVYARTHAGRCVGYSSSEDFIHWSETINVMARGPEDPPDYEVYGMPVFKYEGLYIGLPWAFLHTDPAPLDVQLAASRDGIAWQKVAKGRRFIPLGPAGAFDDGMVLSASPVRVGDELWFYYMGLGFPHGEPYAKERKHEGAIGLAKLRLDGFVSLSSYIDSGATVATCPVRFTGHRLLVNCNTPKGWLRVELQDANGAPIPGYSEGDCDTLCADAVRQVVTWKGKSDVSSLAGNPIRVKLRLGDGELFSFGFAQ